jgi:glycosyltransferase involved in cell wall biosynthesis
MSGTCHITNCIAETVLDFSVIIPTYQRRDLVVSTVCALARQEYGGTFEVVVVVDGSSDNSASALRALDLPFPLTVLEQPNRGLATTRNRGAAAARGDLLLFLDDDMEADPNLLAEHTLSHQAGADVVTGHVPLNPTSPDNFLSASVKAWAEDREKLLSSAPDSLDFLEIVGGQLSISRKLFLQLNGFDMNFTKNGTFGNEDRDLACRLLDAGYKVAFNPKAISWQTYVVTPRQFLRNYRQAGAADVNLASKHPDRSDRIFNPECIESRMDSLVWRWLRGPIRSIALKLVETEKPEQWRIDLFWRVWKLEYFQGIRDGRKAHRMTSTGSS